MATMTNLTIGGTSPTASATSTVTYTIASKGVTLVRWEDRTSGIYAQYGKATLGIREATVTTPIRKVTFKLSLPVVHSIASIDTVVGYIDADLSVRVPSIATAAEIDLAFYRLAGFFPLGAIHNAMLGDFQV